jgi:hypothetical protein
MSMIIAVIISQLVAAPHTGIISGSRTNAILPLLSVTRLEFQPENIRAGTRMVQYCVPAEENTETTKLFCSSS